MNKKAMFFATMAIALLIVGCGLIYGFGSEWWTNYMSIYPERVQNLCNSDVYQSVAVFSCVTLSGYATMRTFEEWVFN